MKHIFDFDPKFQQLYNCLYLFSMDGYIFAEWKIQIIAHLKFRIQ